MTKSSNHGDQVSGANSEGMPPVAHVLTAEERDALEPDDILQRLKDGNKRFVAGSLTNRDYSKQVRDAAEGQSPMAVILSCLDSRIPVEDVFDQGIGDVFVARVAGNFENTDILGSMEFGCLPEEVGGGGARLIFVLGHESCGAVRHAVAGTDAGNITAMLQNIQPAIRNTAYDGDRSDRNTDFVNRVAAENVRLTVARILDRSDILCDLVRNGQIKIVGGMYHMENGEVEIITIVDRCTKMTRQAHQGA